MNELSVFQNNQFGSVRVVMMDDEPWFVAKDVCECLELSNTSQSCSKLDEDERVSFQMIPCSSVTSDV